MNDLVPLINQLIDLKQKLSKDNVADNYERNWNRIFDFLEQNNYVVQIPLGEKYTDTRTDCEASLVGKLGSQMFITQVIKPIVYLKEGNALRLVQKGVVIVENK